MTRLFPDDVIQFDPKTHTYRVGGKVYPGVTDIIKAAGLIDSTWFNREATDRGTLVHSATALYDQGRLNMNGVRDDVLPYLDGWIKFREESKCKILEIETRLYSETLGYAGTIDRIIKLHGRWAILDLKACAPQAWHGMQLAAYRSLVPGAGYKTFILHLRNTGTFKLVETEAEPERQAFLAALNIYNYKKGNGLL